MRALFVLFIMLLALLALSHALKTPKSDVLTVTFAMEPNANGIESLRNLVLTQLSNISHPNYGLYLTQKEIDEMTRTSPEDVQKVKMFLTSHNVTNCEFRSDSVKCVAPAKTFSKITKFPKQILFAEHHVTHSKHILKFAHYSQHKKHTKFVTREVLMRVYNITGNGYVNNSRISTGAMEFGGRTGFSQKNLLKEQTANGVESNPVPKDHIIGVDYTLPNLESELDMAVNWWAAANISLWYEDFKGWMFAWATDFQQRENVPQVVSLSYGWDEHEQCGFLVQCGNSTNHDYVRRTNFEFLKIAARGITMVVASGDAGSPGRTNEMCHKNQPHINAIFPGGSPYVLSVGATYLKPNHRDEDYKWKTPICQTILNCSTSNTEATSSFSRVHWTSGAAFTTWQNTPFWQAKQVQKYLSSGVTLPNSTFFNKNGRAYPDVSALGHSCATYAWLLGWIPIDGTSCSAPIMASIISYLNEFQLQRGKPLLGYVNPLFYKMHETQPSTFNDISEGTSSCTEAKCCGTDFGFQAMAGMWDLPSGLGTPNVGNMLQWLAKHH